MAVDYSKKTDWKGCAYLLAMVAASILIWAAIISLILGVLK